MAEGCDWAGSGKQHLPVEKRSCTAGSDRAKGAVGGARRLGQRWRSGRWLLNTRLGLLRVLQKQGICAAPECRFCVIPAHVYDLCSCQKPQDGDGRIYLFSVLVPHASHLPLNAGKITDVTQVVWGDSVQRRKMGGWGSQGGSQEACISALLPPLTPLSGPQILHGQEKASPPASNVLTIYDAWECHCTGAWRCRHSSPYRQPPGSETVVTRSACWSRCGGGPAVETVRKVSKGESDLGALPTHRPALKCIQPCVC
ncbi:uncharacterized protein LOC117197594 [Orcinus orca]|uniref:uncharacterized protein LOC117197594 n=1 Tax=Orcinus orca TaxID=9733 RepID=UPI001441D183|nr:uncharacterized protein LOC117197594 [Orcinus orca]